MSIKSHKDIFMSTYDPITILARDKRGRNKKPAAGAAGHQRRKPESMLHIRFRQSSTS
ncbi:hypothetical protein SAMCCGM7_Ch3277 [Sinorhizobium americanum CCGM7]|nr:hypothetical protein SAMCCGM7_Ch3277 [Sinorhizobium americanum CCGM7]